MLAREVPYAYDWQAVGVPWYFPTTAEALRAGRGDCESRAVVLASVLTAKGIPNELRVSIGHIWVDYPGKQASALENAGVQIAGTQDGRFFLRWPADFELGREVSEQLAIHWTPAPPWRVLLLVAGLSLIVIWNALARLLGAGRLVGRRPAAGRRRARRGGSPGRRGRQAASLANGRFGEPPGPTAPRTRARRHSRTAGAGMQRRHRFGPAPRRAIRSCRHWLTPAKETP